MIRHVSGAYSCLFVLLTTFILGSVVGFYACGLRHPHADLVAMARYPVPSVVMDEPHLDRKETLVEGTIMESGPACLVVRKADGSFYVGSFGWIPGNQAWYQQHLGHYVRLVHTATIMEK